MIKRTFSWFLWLPRWALRKLSISKPFAIALSCLQSIFAWGLIFGCSRLAHLSWLCLLVWALLWFLPTSSLLAQTVTPYITATFPIVTPGPTSFGPTNTPGTPWSTLTAAPTDENGCPEGLVPRDQVGIIYQFACPICIEPDATETPEYEFPTYEFPTYVYATQTPSPTPTPSVTPTAVTLTPSTTPSPTPTPSPTVTPTGGIPWTCYYNFQANQHGFVIQQDAGHNLGGWIGGVGFYAIYTTLLGSPYVMQHIALPKFRADNAAVLVNYVHLVHDTTAGVTPTVGAGSNFIRVSGTNIWTQTNVATLPEPFTYSGASISTSIGMQMRFFVNFNSDSGSQVLQSLVVGGTGLAPDSCPNAPGPTATPSPTLTPTTTPVGFVDCSRPQDYPPIDDAPIMDFDPGLEFVFTRCYRLFPIVDLTLPGGNRIQFPGIDLCLDFYRLPRLVIYGIVITPSAILIVMLAWFVRRWLQF